MQHGKKENSRVYECFRLLHLHIRFGAEAEYEFPAATKVIGVEEVGQEAAGASQHQDAGTLSVMQLVLISLIFLTVLAWIEVLFYAVRNPQNENVEYLLALAQTDPVRQHQMLQQVRVDRRRQRTQLLYHCGVCWIFIGGAGVVARQSVIL